jgi:pimeloyl-ACP methyl ester carboxylesterase
MPAEVRAGVTRSASPPVPLFCRDEGTGSPIVLLHGIGADHTVWNSVIPRLSGSFRVLAPDLRGHGRSVAPVGAGFRFEDLAEDLLALLAAKHASPAHWVGLSGGALLALRIGLDTPEHARSVVLVAGSAYTDGHTRAIGERWAETYAKEGPDAFAIRLLKDLYYPDWIEAHMEIADRLREEVPRRDYRAATLWAKEIATFDERGRLPTLRPPVLVIQGMDDEVVDASHARILRQSIPGAKMRILAQTGHMVPIERPEETADAVATFVRDVEGRPPT